MKFTCSTKLFADAIKTVSRANPSRLPDGMSGVFLRVEDGRLEARAFDGNIHITRTLPVGESEDGRVMIPKSYLQDIVARLASETLTFTFERNSNMAHIKAGAASFKLVTASNDISSMAVKNGKKFTIDAEQFGKLVGKVAFACARNEQRIIFTGCHLSVKDGKATLAGTNTHRMAIKSCPVKEAEEIDGALIPAQALAEVARIAKEDSGDVEVQIDAAKAGFYTSSTSLVVSLISGKYPEYRRAVPDNEKTAATVDKEGLTGVLERISPIAKSNTANPVLLEFADGAVKCSATDNAVGMGEETLPAEISGEPISIALNAHYLSDVLRVMDGEKLTLKMNASLKPATVFDSDSDYIHVITPIRMKE